MTSESDDLERGAPTESCSTPSVSAGGCCASRRRLGTEASPPLDAGMGWWNVQRERLPWFPLIPHIWRLVAEGRPVEFDRLAAAASWSVEDVEAALRGEPGADWDEQGRLVGHGLTLRPTPHRFTFDGRTVYAFCASDALSFPVVLGRPGTAESTCPASGRPIRVELTPDRVERVDPPGAVVSLVRPASANDVRGEVCALGRFFASEEAAAEWLAAHPEGMVHSVEEDFRLHREIMHEVGWAHPVAAAR
jgi:alkylmercury lyase